MLPGTKPRARERGIALISVLVTLVVMTLIVVSVTATANFGFRIAASTQYHQEAIAAAQQVIDMRVADIGYFSTTTSSTENVDTDGDGDSDYTVVISAPRCLGMSPATGYSHLASTPMVGIWEVVSTASSATSGARATLTQGIKMTVPVGTVCTNS